MQIAAKRKIKRKAITEEAKRQTVVDATYLLRQMPNTSVASKIQKYTNLGEWNDRL
jgi:hypothetical protein